MRSFLMLIYWSSMFIILIIFLSLNAGIMWFWFLIVFSAFSSTRNCNHLPTIQLYFVWSDAAAHNIARPFVCVETIMAKTCFLLMVAQNSRPIYHRHHPTHPCWFTRWRFGHEIRALCPLALNSRELCGGWVGWWSWHWFSLVSVVF